MFPRCAKRRKAGKEHPYWSVVENRRLSDQRVVQRHVLYLGELNGVQESSWRKTVDLFGQDEDAPRHVALFPEEHAPTRVGTEEFSIMRVRLAQMDLRRPRQWGACWLGCHLWEQLGWASSGGINFRPAARARVGIKSCKRSCFTGSSIRARNGGCTGIGSSTRSSRICSAEILRWRKFIASTHAMTNSWRTKLRSSEARNGNQP